MNTQRFNTVVVGGGPAGLAAATEATSSGSVLVVEREARAGGILKQCIHDGFGVVRFGQKLSGPEYADRFVKRLAETDVKTTLLSFVTDIAERGNEYEVTYVCREGVQKVLCKNVILATGCRERTRNAVSVHGTRPSGVYTAGSAQHLVNMSGVLPGRNCVILGSGDIGLIMARRLTLEGAKVLGVYEAKPVPSGLTRNIKQCLDDFDIPLHLSATVTRVFGEQRLTAVEVSDVDEKMQPIAGTERTVPCDTLILAVGLIPENELASKLGVVLDPATKGAVVDQYCQTSKRGIFQCGNALHVNDLVDYVSESAEIAGRATTLKLAEPNKIDISRKGQLLYFVPQRLDVANPCEKVVCYFRAAKELVDMTLTVTVDGKRIFAKKYNKLLPPEMERIVVDFGKVPVSTESKIEVELLETSQNGTVE